MTEHDMQPHAWADEFGCSRCAFTMTAQEFTALSYGGRVTGCG